MEALTSHSTVVDINSRLELYKNYHVCNCSELKHMKLMPTNRRVTHSLAGSTSAAMVLLWSKISAIVRMLQFLVVKYQLTNQFL